MIQKIIYNETVDNLYKEIIIVNTFEACEMFLRSFNGKIHLRHFKRNSYDLHSNGVCIILPEKHLNSKLTLIGI